ncbi:MAG: hypothetical protein C0599_07580 [Salinivirgaceae bacterium]|nr:MAG: hypothetical protein C0599_07580 [Salinivirgaceae bacterium]
MNAPFNFSDIAQDTIDLNELALQLFQFQANENQVYKKFIEALNIDINEIKSITDIPFMPVEFFKSQRVTC